MSRHEIRAWLDAHVNLETGVGTPAGTPPTPSLERIRQLTELLGAPQSAYPVVHVTGTNGKSSTARMTAALLAGQGLSVGLYTSPHLERVNERIAWNGAPLDDDALDQALEAVRRVEDLMDSPPSYFEILTAAAFSHFADIAVDAAVVEVGLGGTWDATNVADATVAVVTNVGVDHVEYLGPDRAGIAKEKAGIVKEGSLLVLGETDPELAPVFMDAARLEGVTRRDLEWGVRENFLAFNGRLLTMWSGAQEYAEVFLLLHGAHQGDNAACALAAADAFFAGATLEHQVVEEALASVEMPGRMEVVGRQPLVLLDGAHNVAGARALVEALDEEFVTLERTLVVGLLREKEPQEMLDALDAVSATRLIACRPPSPRALDPDVVAAAARNVGLPAAAVEVADTVPEAVARALATTAEEGQVVVTGSLYTVGAARSVLAPH